MCLSFKGQIETEEEVVSPIRIRKRWSPARKEMILELVRSYPKNNASITFWMCICGSQVRTDILICHSCGRHRHRHSQRHQRLSEELHKVEKGYESLKKEIKGIEENLKEVKKDCAEKKEPVSDNPKEDGCKCAKKAEEKKHSCKCEDKKESRKECHCPPPTPAPMPQPPPQILPQPPFIPMMPGPYFEADPRYAPKLTPPPEPRPVCPIQEPPIVNVIVPEYRQKRRRHRTRSPSVSSDSSVSVRSFQRVRQHVSSLSRRLWTVEKREDVLEQESKLRQLEEERREELARERARRIDNELRRERSRGRWEERPFWWRREFTEVEADVLPYTSPVLRKDEPRFRHQRRWHEDDRWGPGRC